WPEGLQGEEFDKVRDRFSKSFEAATRQVHSGKQPSRALMNGLRADLNKLDANLGEQAQNGTLSPSSFITSRRRLNQLRDTVRGMGDPRVLKACRGEWRKNVRTVADLVGHLKKNGLVFGPAVSGGEASYTATFLALRNYEIALSQLAER